MALLGLAIGVVAATRASASLDIAGGEILYTANDSDHNLVVEAIRSDGSRRRRLAHVGSSPVWSPDGTRLAYWGRCAPNGTGGLCVGDASGRHPRLMFNSECFTDHEIAWAPDGSTLAFTCREAAQLMRMFVVRLAAPSARRAVVRARGRFATLGGVAWSPDGSKIAFYETGATDGGRSGELELIRPDGTHLRYVASIGDIAANDFTTSWSRNGQLAYQCDYKSFVVLDAAGKTAWVGRGIAATLSPNGRQVAYWRDDAAYIRDLVEGGTRRIFPTVTQLPASVWAPGGGELAFAGDCKTGVAGLCILIAKADGTPLRRLRAAPDIDIIYKLAWRRS